MVLYVRFVLMGYITLIPIWLPPMVLFMMVPPPLMPYVFFEIVLFWIRVVIPVVMIPYVLEVIRLPVMLELLDAEMPVLHPVMLLFIIAAGPPAEMP